MSLKKSFITWLLLLSTFSFGQSISPIQPVAGAGQTVTFTASGLGTPNPGWSVACQGTGCQAGSINQTSGVYTGASVSAFLHARGCQIYPRNNIFNHPVNAAAGIGVNTYNTQWIGRAWSFLAPFHIAGSPGNISEIDNITPDSSPRMIYNFFEGGISGQKFLEPSCPYCQTEAGWSQDVQVNGSFDNHIMSIDPTTCEYDQIYKWYLDLPTASFVANGSTTLVNFTTQTIRTLEDPVHVWVYKLSGSCPASLINGDTGWFATVTSQPNQHGGSGQLSLPVSFSGSTSGCLITGVDEGNGFSQNTSSLNAQSGAIYPLGSNSLLPGGTNAAQTQIVGLRPDELYQNVASGETCNNADGGLVLSACHMVVTTAGNPMIAPIGIWPAQNGICNNESGHPCISVTNITKASSGQVTIQESCNGSCISVLNVCSGIPQFSGGQNGCSSPSGQQFDIVFVPNSCTGSWAALNGQHLTATYVDPEDFTIPVNTSGYSGSYPGGCQIYFDWAPYGTIFRIKASFNCETISNANAALIPYTKAECRRGQTFGYMLTDGTTNSDTWDTDMHSSEFLPDFMHDVYYGLQASLLGTNSAGTGFSQILEAVDVSSLDVNGATDGTTNYQRVTVTYTGSTGSASTDIIQQATTVGVKDRKLIVPNFPAPTGCGGQIVAWINGNVNTSLTYTISPSSGAGSVSSTGAITCPASVTQPTPAKVAVCSTAVPSACDNVQLFYYPVGSDGVLRLWLGGKDGGQSGCNGQQTNYFTDNLGHVWQGTWSDPGYLRGWESNYMNTTGIGFMGGLFGSWTTNCAAWSSVTNGQLFGTSTSSQGNDELITIAMPQGVTQATVTPLIEAGYNTTAPKQSIFDWMGGGSLTTPATIFASYQDSYVLAGGQYKGYSAGPFVVPVTDDGVLHFGQQIRTFVGSQAEGNSISAIAITPGAAGLSILTTSLPNGTKGVAYNAPLSGSGGSGTYTWSVSSGTLPAGLNLSTCTTLSCSITGTPSATGTSSFTIELQDSNGDTPAFANLSITINAVPTLTITTTTLPNGPVNAPYSTLVQATGGIGPYTWSIISGSLPPGINMSNCVALSCALLGTPTAVGIYPFEIQIQDSENIPQVATANLSITITGAGKLTILTTSLPAGVVNSGYLAGIVGSGGSGTYKWSVSSGSLPNGLIMTCQSLNCTISGTPTLAAVFNFQVELQDSNGDTPAFANLSITINSSLSITTTTLPNGQVNAPYSQNVSATGGIPPYHWSLNSGSLPPGLTLGSSCIGLTCTISGTPTQQGTYNFVVQISDSERPQRIVLRSLQIVVAGLTITTNSLPNGTVNSVYSGALAGTGGVGPYTWSISQGSLPPGLGGLGSCTTLSCTITGTPTIPGAFNFTVQLQDSQHNIATAPLSIQIAPHVVLSPLSCSGGQTSIPYNCTFTASGGTAPYTFSIVGCFGSCSGGNIPGLSLTTLSGTTAKEAGTPTTIGYYSIIVKAVDANGNPAQVGYPIRITSGSTPPPGASLQGGKVSKTVIP